MFFTAKSPNVTQRSVSQENAFKKRKHLFLNTETVKDETIQKWVLPHIYSDSWKLRREFQWQRKTGENKMEKRMMKDESKNHNDDFYKENFISRIVYEN